MCQPSRVSTLGAKRLRQSWKPEAGSKQATCCVVFGQPDIAHKWRYYRVKLLYRTDASTVHVLSSGTDICWRRQCSTPTPRQTTDSRPHKCDNIVAALPHRNQDLPSFNDPTAKWFNYANSGSSQAVPGQAAGKRPENMHLLCKQNFLMPYATSCNSERLRTVSREIQRSAKAPAN